MTEAPVLVAGSTGFLGSEIVKQLAATGCPVRAFTRQNSDPDRVSALRRAGAQIVVGDLRNVESVAAACQGVKGIVSTATSLMSRVEGDSIEAVDERGQLDLVAAAARAGVERFVFLSFPPSAVDHAFQRAKRAIERRLRESPLGDTIVQAASFAEIWLSPQLGFDPMRGRARVFGNGTARTSWISVRDVASFSVAAIVDDRFAGKTFSLGGPDALSYEDVLALFTASGVGEVEVERVPEAELEAQLRAATDPRQEAFAAAMLGRAHDQVVSSADARQLWAGQLTPMTEFVARTIAAAQAD